MQATGQFSDSSVFSIMAAQDGPLDRVLHVMELLAVSGSGLGEVLPDYAAQTGAQISELMQACSRFSQGGADADTVSVMMGSYFVLSGAATVLEMTPAAMQRNKAEMIGTREKLSREEVVRIARAFRSAPELQLLMSSEEASRAMLMQAIALQTAH